MAHLQQPLPPTPATPTTFARPSKRAPVPLIISSFPAPPSHIPPTRSSSGSNPPPTGPPCVPLPPLPSGPSRISEHDQLFLWSAAHARSTSGSPQSTSVQTHTRSFSNSSTFNKTTPINCSKPQFQSPRVPSPDIATILSATPRPALSLSKSCSGLRASAEVRSDWRISEDEDEAAGAGAGAWQNSTRESGRRRVSGKDVREEKEGEDSDSDSSLDLHTPLPHLMLRHGLLSSNSKLLPQSDCSRAATPLDGRPGSIMSLVSNGSVMTKSGVVKDERDTLTRRVRHRDGRLLRGGIGLTTGLGWSDSEDEDAPSPLTRRLSTLNLSRRSSASSISSAKLPFPSPPSLNKEKSLPPLPAGGLKKKASGTLQRSIISNGSTMTPATLNGTTGKYAFPTTRVRTISTASNSTSSPPMTMISSNAVADPSSSSIKPHVRPLQLPRQSRIGDRPAVPVPSPSTTPGNSPPLPPPNSAPAYTPAFTSTTTNSLRAPTSSLSASIRRRSPILSGTTTSSTTSAPSSPAIGGIPSFNYNHNGGSTATTPTTTGIMRPKPRTGTGMIYRTSSYTSSTIVGSGGGSKMRTPTMMLSTSVSGGGGSIGRSYGIPTAIAL